MGSKSKRFEKKYTIKEIFKYIFELLICIFFPVTFVIILWLQPINTKDLIEPIKNIVNYDLVMKTFSAFFLACILSILFDICFKIDKILKELRGKK